MAIIEPAQYTRPRPKPVPPAVPNYPLTIPQQRPSYRQVTVPLNYRALLAGDLALSPTLAAINQNAIAQKQALQAQQQQARIAFGEAQPGADALTNQLATENTQAGLSTLAGLQRAYEGSQAAAAESLAARGLLRSGGYLQRSNANLLQSQIDQQRARQDLLSTLAGQQATYQQGQQELAQQAATATSDALNRIIGQVNAGTLVPGVRNVPNIRRNPAAPAQVYTGGEARGTGEGYRHLALPKPRRPAAPARLPTLARNSY